MWDFQLLSNAIVCIGSFIGGFAFAYIVEILRVNK